MIEVYSEDVSVEAASPIPLQNVALQTNSDVTLIGESTLQFNRGGIYQVAVSASAIATEAGLIAIELVKDGTLQPQACAGQTATDTTGTHSLAFTTFVVVPQNTYYYAPYGIPTKISILNESVASEFTTIDIAIHKIA